MKPEDFWIYGYPGQNVTPDMWTRLYPNFPLDSSTDRLGTGPQYTKFRIYRPAMDGVQSVRRHLKLPMGVNSCYRDKYWNQKKGGSPRSQHLLSTAFDIDLTPFKDPQKVGDDIEDIALAFGAKGFGRYKSFIHIDWRNSPDVAYWDMR